MELGDQTVALLAVAATAATAVLAFVVLVLAWRLAGVRRRLASTTLPMGRPGLAALNAGEPTALAERVGRVEEVVTRLQDREQQAGVQVGVVRYDAFPGVVGTHSFSVAVLDASGDGVIVTGLNSRTDSRCFAKPVGAAEGDVVLSDEERQAVAAALAPTAVDVPAATSRRRRAS